MCLNGFPVTDQRKSTLEKQRWEKRLQQLSVICMEDNGLFKIAYRAVPGPSRSLLMGTKHPWEGHTRVALEQVTQGWLGSSTYQNNITNVSPQKYMKSTFLFQANRGALISVFVYFTLCIKNCPGVHWCLWWISQPLSILTLKTRRPTAGRHFCCLLWILLIGRCSQGCSYVATVKHCQYSGHLFFHLSLNLFWVCH